VHVTPNTAQSLDFIVKGPDGGEVSDFGVQCYKRDRTFSQDIGGLYNGGNGTYTITVLSGCKDQLAVGSYTISFKSCGLPNQKFYNECYDP